MVLRGMWTCAGVSDTNTGTSAAFLFFSGATQDFQRQAKDAGDGVLVVTVRSRSGLRRSLLPGLDAGKFKILILATKN